ncbi:hypothetical protein ACMVVW_004527 [Escherichia coli]|uniref:hypothetical protein n=1 Tax=Escherichia coli TaxID=562 RepID=UPI0010B7CCA2|nr:hypothetical protein [Escherichia coli]GCK56619.1 hypothetical protein BvCmsC117A_00946 [Escherichia coli]HAX9727915.1 hypothetical protein [Escherichia coli]HBA2725967.1 hypothetical protein [Escherichia coli]
MAHSITVRLNKTAREFQAGENIGFNIRAGVQYYDRQTKKKEWTNYSAVVFAKPGAQADYYRSVLVEGGIVEITGENIRVDVYQGQNGQSITLELLNAKIGFATSGNSQHQQSSNHQNHPEYDDSIPF